ERPRLAVADVALDPGRAAEAFGARAERAEVGALVVGERVHDPVGAVERQHAAPDVEQDGVVGELCEQAVDTCGEHGAARIYGTVPALDPLWYHTLELGDGTVTPGWMDLRPIVERLPWPDVRGKRCLDVGTYDGFLAFELERRGAAAVVATDISDHSQWDWPRAQRERGAEY